MVFLSVKKLSVIIDSLTAQQILLVLPTMCDIMFQLISDASSSALAVAGRVIA